jgi:hypothetical protein
VQRALLIGGVIVVGYLLYRKLSAPSSLPNPVDTITKWVSDWKYS